MPEYLSNKKRKQSIGINSYSEYTDTTKIIGNVLVGFGSIGVGTTIPTQDVDVNTIRVRDTLYDYTNSGGEFGYYLVKDTDGIKWVAVPPIDSNAIFVAENNNILGVSSFTGLNIISDELIGVSTNPINPNFADITILPRWLKSGETGIYTTKNVGIGTTIPTTDFQVGFGTTGVTIDGSVGVVSAIGYYGNYAFIDQITVNDQLNVVGLGSTLVAAYLASAGGITTTGGDLYVGGSLFADKLDIINLKVVNIEATGITTLNVGIVSTFRVTDVSTLGVTSTKDLFVDANLEVSGITTLGITSTKDLYVDENLYVVGIATANRFSTGVIGSAINITSNTISGPAEIIIDPADVGDNSGAVRIKGDLFVDGEEFIVNSTTIELADFNVGIASTVGTNFLLDGAGIGIGSTNIRKTLTYDYSSDSLKSSENFDLESGKVYKINEVEVLSSTQLTIENINSSGISTLGITTVEQLYVSGVSTFVGVGTFIDDLYVGGDLYVADDIFFDELNAKNANITGITTLNVGIVSTFRVTGVSTLGVTSTKDLFVDANLEVSGITTLGITSISQLNVSGITTLGVTSTTNLTSQQLLVTGITTLGVTSTINLTSQQLNVSGITTLGVTSTTNLTSQQLRVTGITTLGVTSTTNLTSQQLDVSGITTLGITSTTNLTSQQLRVTGITTLGITSTTNLTSKELNVTGIATLGVTSTTNLTSQQLYVSGVSTFVGVGTFIDDLYVGGDLYVADDIFFDELNAKNANITGITTLNVGIVSTLTVTGVSTLGITSTTNLTSQQLNVSGIATLGITSTANLTSQELNVTGIATLGVTSTTNLTSQQLNVSGITTLGVTTITQLYVSGVSTFSDRITGIISTATKLENQRIFEITGDVAASPIFFDGTGNVSFAATIQPNSVELGADTFGDYVKSISGTVGQIVVTDGTGAGSTPVISFDPNPTIGGNVTIGNNLQVTNNLNVDGNITIGGTSATLNTETLTVTDSQILLGVTTTSNLSDISTDLTANTGGIAIASTEGTPLVNLTVVGIDTLPATYKRFVWVSAGTFAGLGTDAWLSNYAIGIGSTQFPAGTRLAAGSVQFTENDLAVVRNINSSGISTLGVTTTTNLTSQQLNVSGITTLGITSTTNLTTRQLNVTGILTASRIVGTSLSISGISTIANFLMTPVGTGATVGGIGVTYYGDGSNLTNVVASSGYATTAGIATSVIGGIASVTSLNVTGITTLASIVGTSLSITGISTLGVTSTTNLTSQQLLVTGITTLGVTSTTNLTSQQLRVTGITTLGVTSTTNLTSQQLNVSGITTLGVTSTTNLTSQQLNVSGITTLGVTSTTNLTSQQLNVSGITTLGITSTTNLTSQQLRVTGITTLASIVGTSLSISGITTLGVTSTTNLTSQQLNVSGITTLGVTSITNLTSQQLRVTGITTLGVTSTTNLTSQQLLVTGITTLSNIVGTSLSISGISTIANFLMTPVGTGATVGGIGVTYYGDGSGLTKINISSVVGVVTYAEVAGIATNVIGGIASVTSLNVSGISTLANIVGTSLSISGISTIANFLMTPVGTGATVGGIGVTYYGDGSGLTKINISSVVGVVTYAEVAGIATNVIGGIGSITQLQVSGISTFSNGPILVGSTTSTGTASQPLQVTGGAYVSGNLGIGTTNPTTPLSVELYGVKTGFGTFIASAGITTDVDNFLISNTNFKTAEYTVHIESSTSIQAQKVLVMQNGINAFSQEYGIMYDPTFMISIGATVSGGRCKLQFTPESGISGLMTYRFTRGTMI